MPVEEHLGRGAAQESDLTWRTVQMSMVYAEDMTGHAAIWIASTYFIERTHGSARHMRAQAARRYMCRGAAQEDRLAWHAVQTVMV